MISKMVLVKEDPEGITFKAYIQPRSSHNMIVGPHGDAVKIKLTAPPVGGAANKMCIEYLAKSLKIPKSAVKIVSGHSSRTKWIHVRYRRGDSIAPAKRDQIKQRINSLIGI